MIVMTMLTLLLLRSQVAKGEGEILSGLRLKGSVTRLGMRILHFIWISKPKIAKKLEVPDDDTESYIVYHHIDDEQELKEPQFCIIWTSKKLSARIGGELTQDDATYRLLWQGYLFYVLGRSHSCGRFFPTHVMLASHEVLGLLL